MERYKLTGMLRSYTLYIISLLFACTSLLSSPLQERIARATDGDYLVIEGGKMITVLSIRSQTPTTLVLEEISIPSQNLKKKITSWNEWVRAKAPGHTSWSILEIDRANGEILECYSFTRSSWIQLSSQESLIATLLSLPLTLVPLNERRKIGPPPLPGEMDTRKIWEPPVFIEGKKLEGIHFDAYQTSWPQDQSPLSGHPITLYFDQAARFPLPLWIQIETSHLQFAFKTIDSGKHLSSPYRKFPRRIPQFLGGPQKIKNGLKLFLKSPKYFRNFDLFAVDVTTPNKELYPMTYSLVEGKEESLALEISEDELRQVLTPNHCYTWLLVPANHPDSYTETIKPFTWTGLLNDF